MNPEAAVLKRRDETSRGGGMNTDPMDALTCRSYVIVMQTAAFSGLSGPRGFKWKSSGGETQGQKKTTHTHTTKADNIEADFSHNEVMHAGLLRAFNDSLPLHVQLTQPAGEMPAYLP